MGVVVVVVVVIVVVLFFLLVLRLGLPRGKHRSHSELTPQPQ